MTKKVSTLAIIIILLSTTLAGASQTKASVNTVVVPDDYSTINAALSNASDGTTIFVKRGIYNERLTIDKAISLIGEGKEETTINGQKSGTVVLIRHDNVNLSGFNIIYDSVPNSPQPIWMWSTRLAGIHVLSAKNCSVFNNQVSDCGVGVWLYDARQNNISSNVVFRNDYGIRVEASTNNNISTNTVKNNWGGIRLISSANNFLTENEITANVQNFGISNGNLANSPDLVDSSNRVDGKPIYYWIGVSNRNVPSDAGYVALVNCSSINVQGLSITKNQEGIFLAGTQNCSVSYSTLSASSTGIILQNSFLDRVTGNNINTDTGINANGTGTQIKNNTINANNQGISTNGKYQIVADNNVKITAMNGYMITCSSSHTNITNNKLTGTSYAYAVIEGPDNIFYGNTILDSYGLRVTSDRNIIAENNVTDIGAAISVSGLNNTVFKNTITKGFGLTVAGHGNLYFANQIENNTIGADYGGLEAFASNNVIYQNNFIGNKQQIKNYSNKGNSWDNGSVGNYWSDYNGSDLDNDGMGDQPYLIYGLQLMTLVPIVTGQDNYPLMAPFDISSIKTQLPQWNFNYSLPFVLSSPSPQPTFTPLPNQTKLPTSTPQKSANLTPSPSIPEFSSWIILPLAMITVSFVVVASKRRRKDTDKS